MSRLFTVFSMPHITRQVVVTHAGKFVIKTYGIIAMAASPVTDGAIRFRSTVTYPSFFFEINGNREVFYYAIQRW